MDKSNEVGEEEEEFFEAEEMPKKVRNRKHNIKKSIQVNYISNWCLNLYMYYILLLEIN